MTKSRSLLLLVFIISFSQLSRAQPAVDLIWGPANGTGNTEINAKVGDIVELNILVTDTSGEGLLGAGLSLDWDSAKLSGGYAEECPSPPNIYIGICNDIDERNFTPLQLGVAEGPGFADGFDAYSSDLSTGYYNETMYLGRIAFLVLATPVEVSVGYRPETDGIYDGEEGLWFPEATATIVPPLPDTDGDGVLDAADNCTLVSNPSQCNGDGDAFGNHCDADFNNDGITNGLDIGPMKAGFGTVDAELDLNCDGIVNGLDIGPLKAMFGTVPGPAGALPL
jgi:hypothetical protein